MSKTSKVLLLVASFVPLLLGVRALLYMHARAAVSVIPPSSVFNAEWCAILLAYVSWLPLIIYYLIHLARNCVVRNGSRRSWQIALIWCSVVAMPIYWYKFIWRPTGGENPQVL